MLLRIFLILSILAGAGVIAITHYKVKPHVQNIVDERDKQTKRADGLDRDLRKTKDELSSTKRTLQKTQEDLSETSSQLATANKKNADLDKQNKDLTGKLAKSTDDLTKAKQELFAWTSVAESPAAVKAIVDNNKKLVVDLDVAKEENKILQEAHLKLGKLYTNLIGQDLEIVAPLPPGLKGTVLVVDPKWDFVVLDVGEKQQVVPNGVMMVSREGKLVAKVKVVSVQIDRSIANIMPGWKLNEVSEGDLVIGVN